MAHDWPGNVRELRNAVTYAVAMSPGRTIGLEHLPQRLQLSASSASATAMPGAGSPVPSVPAALSLTARRQAQQNEILAALAESNNNVSQAARLLGIHRTTLINRMLRLGLRLNKICGHF